MEIASIFQRISRR